MAKTIQESAGSFHYSRPSHTEYIQGLRYHQCDYTEPFRVRGTFGNELPQVKEGRILDWGCSTGITTGELLKLYPAAHIVGLDVKKRAVGEARRYHRASIEQGRMHFIHGDGYYLGQYAQPQSLDAIFLMNNFAYAMQDLTDDQLVPVAANLVGCARDNGYLCFSAMAQFTVFQKTADDVIAVSQCRGVIPRYSAQKLWHILRQGAKNARNHAAATRSAAGGHA